MISVDVIFITYNQEKYVAQGIESILSQKVSDNVNVRVVIADDCSMDKTIEIIRLYEKNSPFPFVYTDHSKNIGFHKNYRRAFEFCNSDYVAILEGDDWWHSNNHLCQHIDFLERHRCYSMSFNQIRFFNQYSNSYDEPWIVPHKYKFFKITLKDQITKGNQLGNLSACVFRKSLIDTISDEFYKSNFADWDLGMWMAQFGPIVMIKGATSTYRVNNKGQWTKLNAEEKMVAMLNTLETMDGILKFKYHKWFEKGKYNIGHGLSQDLYESWKTKLKRFLHIE